MTKVYVAGEGEREDREVVGVFSTREAADAFVNGNPEIDVTEFELDGLAGQSGLRVWWAAARLSDGRTEKSGPRWTYGPPGTDPHVKLEREFFGGEFFGDQRFAPGGMADAAVATSYVSHEEAVRLATEAREAWLRGREAVSRSESCQ